MNFTNFEPDYVVLTYLAVQKFVVLELLGLVALLVALFHGPKSRPFALLALALAVLGGLAHFAPAFDVRGLLARRASDLVRAGQGLALPVAIWLLLIAALGARNWQIKLLDILHTIVITGFIILWWLSR